MSFYLVQGATSLFLVDTAGAGTTLTLPTDVSLLAKRMRSVILNRGVVLVNSPTRPLLVDPVGESAHVYPLDIKAPASAPTLTAVSGGSLTGSYTAKVAFGVKDDNGNVVILSPYGPASGSVSLSSQGIRYADLPISTDSVVNFRRIARTAASGEEYFDVFDVDDNSTTTAQNALSDEGLPTEPISEDLQVAPSALELIVEWKGRLWAKPRGEIDLLHGTSEGLPYAWPLTFTIGPKGRDTFGITGFIPRRDELGISRRDIIWKLTGSDADTFSLVKVVEGVGVLAPDSVVVVRDIAYFLGAKQGQVAVFEWSSEGVRAISDEKVHPWFNTDAYFNRGEFSNAFGEYNPDTNSYEVYLAAVGGSTINRWVSVGLGTKEWLGPHLTATFNPTTAKLAPNASGVTTLLTGGSDGKVYNRQTTRTDGASDGIAIDVITSILFGEPPAPDIEHYWGEMAIITKEEAAGTLTITPSTGRFGDLTATAAISHDLTTGRERLPRIGTGPGVQLQFEHSTAAQDVEVFGIELPWHELGRR